MTAYATLSRRDPERFYRQVDVAGRAAQAGSAAGLVQLLYGELTASLRAAVTYSPAGNRKLLDSQYALHPG